MPNNKLNSLFRMDQLRIEELKESLMERMTTQQRKEQLQLEMIHQSKRKENLWKVQVANILRLIRKMIKAIAQPNRLCYRILALNKR